MIYYESKNVEYARKLRKEMTPWERKLWYCFFKDISGSISTAKANQ